MTTHDIRETYTTLYAVARKCLEEMRPKGAPNKPIEAYFEAISASPASLGDVFRQFIRSAQNAQMLINVIKFDEREGGIKEVLEVPCGGDYDVARIADMDEDTLVAAFRANFDVRRADSPGSCWRKWTHSLVDSARFLAQFADVGDFDRFVKGFQHDSATRAALPLHISAAIRGIGFALACDALKELGYSDYPKPDVHIKDIVSALGLCPADDMRAYETMLAIAEACDESPYTVDKVFWLVCSGNFYLNKQVVPGRKDELIARARQALA